MTTWDRLLNYRDKESRVNGVMNTITNDELVTILATAEFFGAQTWELKQISFDLSTARYRLFDWLAMTVNGRIETAAVKKVLIYSYIKSKGDVDKFIADLRASDYDIDRSWERIKLDF